MVDAVASQELRQQIRALIAKNDNSTLRVAKPLGVGEATIARILAGLPVRESTLALVEKKLAARR